LPDRLAAGRLSPWAFVGERGLKKLSNSERVRLGAASGGFVHCSLALLFAAAVLSPPLAAATATPATAAIAAAKPAFVIQAEKKYRQARQAVTAAESHLNRVKQQEARESQRAMARYGQWSEPTRLWRKTRAAERNLAFARESERQALTELNKARDAARTARVGGFPKGEFQPPSPFWWLW